MTLMFISLVILSACRASTRKTGKEETSEGSAEQVTPILEDTPMDIGDKEVIILGSNPILYRESSYIIDEKGVGIIWLNDAFNHHDTQLMDEKEIAIAPYDRSSYVLNEKSFGADTYYYPQMKLEKGGTMQLVLCGDGYKDYEIPEKEEVRIHGISVHSPEFKTANGIHVGMTVQQLYRDYDAKVRLEAGEGGEQIEMIKLIIPNYENLWFLADIGTIVKLKGESFLLNSYPDYDTFYELVKKEVLKTCHLERIIVGDYFTLAPEMI